MNKKIFLFAFVFALLLVPFVSAESNIGVFEKSKNLTLIQMCDTCTYVNLDSVIIPNGSTLIFDSLMSKTNQTFYYVFENTNEIGTYIYNVCGDKDGVISCESLSFEITLSGKEFNTKHSLLYIIILIISIAFFGLAFYGFIQVPFENFRNEEGKVFHVNNLKYVKILLFFVSYTLLTWVTNLLVGVTNNFIDTGIEYKFFTVLFSMLTGLMYPLIIIGVIFMIWLISKDMKINKLIDGGFGGR